MDQLAALRDALEVGGFLEDDYVVECGVTSLVEQVVNQLNLAGLHITPAPRTVTTVEELGALATTEAEKRWPRNSSVSAYERAGREGRQLAFVAGTEFAATVLSPSPATASEPRVYYVCANPDAPSHPPHDAVLKIESWGTCDTRPAPRPVLDRKAVREAALRNWWDTQTGDTDSWESLTPEERENVAENSYIDVHLDALVALIEGNK